MHQTHVTKKFNEVMRRCRIDVLRVIAVLHSLHSISVVNLRVFEEKFPVKKRLWIRQLNPCQLFYSSVYACLWSSEIRNASTHADPSPSHDAYILKSTSLQAFN